MESKYVRVDKTGILCDSCIVPFRFLEFLFVSHSPSPVQETVDLGWVQTFWLSGIEVAVS